MALLWCCSRFFQYQTDVVRVDQVRHGPAVEVVFCHTLLGETFVLCALAEFVGYHQRLETDAFMVAKVVPLIKFMSSTELAADRVPHELHQLDAFLCGIAVGAAHKLIEILSDLRCLEISGIRRQVNQCAGHYVLNDFFEAWIYDARSNSVSEAVVQVRQYVSG